MVNISQQYHNQQNNIASVKSVQTSRRPFQPRSINAPVAATSAKKTSTKPIMNPLKSSQEPKLSAASENSSLCKFFDVARTQDADNASIFRRRSLPDEDENDLFTLKRANPVYESDDDDSMSTPSKKQRRSEPEVLHWEDELPDSEDGSFTISFLER